MDERCIYVDDFLDLFYVASAGQDKTFVKVVEQVIEDAPTADVEEVKHGEWIYNTDDFTPKMRCSVCGYNKPLVAGENVEQQPSDYCNNCGAKMDGGKRQ